MSNSSTPKKIMVNIAIIRANQNSRLERRSSPDINSEYLNSGWIRDSPTPLFAFRLSANKCRMRSRLFSYLWCKIPKAALSEKLNLLLKESSQPDYNLRDFVALHPRLASRLLT
jgi:hypothetical protein